MRSTTWKGVSANLKSSRLAFEGVTLFQCLPYSLKVKFQAQLLGIRDFFRSFSEVHISHLGLPETPQHS